jgi:hypothetical protein
MALFGPKVEGDPHKRFPDKYYRQMFFTRPLFEGIEFLAKVERKSKKKMANELMGISRFWGEVLGKYNEAVLAERELAKIPEIVRFIRAYNKMAKQKGFDISKIYNTKTDNKKNS